MASGAVERQFGSHDDLLAALVGAFATRALHGRHTAEALLFEPVGARVNRERLTCRRQYHALIVGIIADGVVSGDGRDGKDATP